MLVKNIISTISIIISIIKIILKIKKCVINDFDCEFKTECYTTFKNNFKGETTYKSYVRVTSESYREIIVSLIDKNNKAIEYCRYKREIKPNTISDIKLDNELCKISIIKITSGNYVGYCSKKNVIYEIKCMLKFLFREIKLIPKTTKSMNVLFGIIITWLKIRDVNVFVLIRLMRSRLSNRYLCYCNDWYGIIEKRICDKSGINYIEIPPHIKRFLKYRSGYSSFDWRKYYKR